VKGIETKAVVKRQASLLDKNLFLVIIYMFLSLKLLVLKFVSRDFDFFKNYKF
jgi:hypothetical protein